MSDAQLADDAQRLSETVRWMIEEHGLMPTLRVMLDILGSIAFLYKDDTELAPNNPK